ncbi:MAG TPA: glycosyltransferase family 9 protein, partial [Solirubrobacteraceae bacterium]|nr:glycosyltransferase family 9 protein [Solirubrobacteraceae bacterium]
VFTLPALDALRAAYPEAEITLLATELHRDLLSDRPAPVDRVVPVPRHPGVREGGPDGDVDEFLAQMRAERFDLALQLHGGGRFSNPFVRRLAARVTAGSHTPDAERLDRSVAYVYLRSEVLRQLALVELVGAVPVGLVPRLAVTARDREAVAAQADGPGPLVVLHPGATDARRRWPAERFALVADSLAAQAATIAITGGPDERELADAVLGAMRTPARNLAGRLSLPALVGLLDRAALVIANDSGPLHLAAAVATPTIGIFWAVNVGNSMVLADAPHRPLASFALNCPDCGRDSLRDACEHRVSHVTDVRAADVLAAAEELLGWDVGDERALARALDPRAP